MSQAQTILLIDADETIHQTLGPNLASEGYVVQTITDGLAGLEMARIFLPDLVIMEVVLSGLDGFSVCRTLSRELRTSIILLTARVGEMDKIIGLDSGADDYVTKPYNLGEFLARVRAVLRRRSELISVDYVKSGDLSLDLVRRKAYKGERLLNLSYKEFDLLAELMAHQGLVLSRSNLVRKVWGYKEPTGSRTVDVHIRWLREKIEEYPSKPKRIVTIQRIGYCFEG